MINIQAFLSVAVDFARSVCLIKIAVFVIIIQELKALFFFLLLLSFQGASVLQRLTGRLQNDVQAATTF